MKELMPNPNATMLGCVSCDCKTDYLCAWCSVVGKQRVLLCERKECREKHEAEGCARTGNTDQKYSWLEAIMGEGEKQALPRYQCHKIVEAVRIKELIRTPDGGAKIIPAEAGIEWIKLSPAYVTKHVPSNGGYYVRYNDGYESFSPREAFDEGYTRLP